jgi:hypothetical protein
MVQRSADVILIEDSQPDLCAVLAELGVGEPSNPVSERELDRLRVQLAALRDHPRHRIDARASTVIGSVHFPLRPTIYFAFVALVKAMGATMALAANPTAGGITTAIVVLDLAEKAQQLISVLDDEELRALEALGAAVDAKQAVQPGAAAASVAEVEALLAERHETLPGLGETLRSMADERRGVRRFELRGETQYGIVP